MARPRVGDLIKQTTDTEGTGAFALGPSVPGFWPFSTFADGTPIYYTVVDNPGAITECEQGIGRFVAGSPDTITRDRVIKSTNSDAKVDWTPGTKTIICTASAEFLNTIIEALDSDLVTTGTSTAYSVATLRPDVGLYEGRFLCVKLHVANGVDPTLAPDGEAAKPIVDIHGSAPAAGALTASYFWFKFDAAADKWVVFSPFGYLSAADLQDQTGNYAAASGTNTLTATFTPALTAHLAGRPLRVLIANTNTGAVTFNPNGLGAKNVVNQSGSALQAGDLAAGGEYEFLYDGTNYQVSTANTATTSAKGLVQLVGSGVDTALADATKALTAAALAALFTGSASGNWIKLPYMDGSTKRDLIIQWGAVTIPHNSTVDVTFPEPFPNAASAAYATLVNDNSVGELRVSVNALTTTKLTLREWDNGSGDKQVYWFAIGH